jgi:Flp pilus assembly protein TadG
MLTLIHGLRRLLRRSRSEEGSALVEFAFAFMMFVSLTFSVFDFGRLFFEEMDVQNAIQEAARYGSTGNHIVVKNPNGTTTTLARVTSIVDTLEADAMGVQFSNITVLQSSVPGGPTSAGAGSPGGYLTVTATVSLPVMTPVLAQMYPNGQFTFTTTVTVMNEPFAANLAI